MEERKRVSKYLKKDSGIKKEGEQINKKKTVEERKRVSKFFKKDSGRKKEGEQMLNERQWNKERG